MKTKVFILAYLSLTSIFVWADDSILQGSWEVAQFTIEKNTDGKVEMVTQETNKNVDGRVVAATDNALRDIQSFIPCPQRWEFKDSTNVVLHFADGMEEVTKFSIEGDKVTIGFMGALQQYSYAINGNKLTLSITHSYSWNQPAGYVASIEEKWTILLEKP